MISESEILQPWLTLGPEGLLLFHENGQETESLPAALARGLSVEFDKGQGSGLLALSGPGAEGELPASLKFWRGFTQEYLTRLCHIPRLREDGWQGGPTWAGDDWAQRFVDGAPPLPGIEYLSRENLLGLWHELSGTLSRKIAESEGDVAKALAEVHPVWRLVGRVTLHLAENKRSQDFPFAFLASYSQRLDSRSRVRYLPLAQALREAAAAKDRSVLQTLLSPLHAAADRSPLLKSLIEGKDIFQVLAWTPDEAYRFLRETPVLEECGLIIKVPNWWAGRRASRPMVQVTLETGEKKSSVGVDALLAFQVTVALGDQVLSQEELERILNADAPLVSLKGQWVEVDRAKLRQALEQWRKAQEAQANGIPFHEGLRWMAGLSLGGMANPSTEDEDTGEWTSIVAGRDLTEFLAKLREPGEQPESAEKIPGLKATLRPYQKTGVEWLRFLGQIGLGACLADDMGLGKTIQIIALLLLRRPKMGESVRPSLLVAPASLLGNWRREIERFAPDLPFLIAHRSALDSSGWKLLAEGKHPAFKKATLFITTYTTLGKIPALLKAAYDVAVLDEAQAIKNVGAAQTKNAKKVDARFRVALTGTPVENRLGDLWSLFDYLNPGLLGKATQFALTAKSMAQSGAGYAPLRRLVRPYILRRMKTDPGVAPDLPAKTEVTAFCSLSKRQATLYQRAVNALAQELAESEGDIQRRGLILTTLMKLKQICDHPSLWSGDATFGPTDSGKFGRLREIASTVADRQEKMLIFSQFREMTAPLADFLAEVFGRTGLILHGSTPVNKRPELVERFQQPNGPPFFVISLKAGGTGLNLTAASHVVHFDRWWNPAVEDQATDRAFRIGQTRQVLVHKFLCQGTVEERIDQLIQDKKKLAADILGSEADGAAKLLTEMNDKELLEFMKLGPERIEEG